MCLASVGKSGNPLRCDGDVSARQKHCRVRPYRRNWQTRQADPHGVVRNRYRVRFADSPLHARIDARHSFILHSDSPRLATGPMPDKRVHQLGFNAERAGCNKSPQVHQWFTPSTTMCNLDDDWLALLCSANRKLPSWQAETRARGKTRGLPTSSATACRWIAI